MNILDIHSFGDAILPRVSSELVLLAGRGLIFLSRAYSFVVARFNAFIRDGNDGE
jgi:hypothetical protein